MAYDIEYKFGFVLPITVTVPAVRPDEETVTLCLGELEDCEAVACINVEEDDSWYIDEFRLENLPGTTTSGNQLEGTLRISPHSTEYRWVLAALQNAWNAGGHKYEIDRIVAEMFPNCGPTELQQDRAIYHQSVL